MLNRKLIANLHATSHIQRRCATYKKNTMKFKIQLLFGLILLLTYSCNNDDDDSNGNETLLFWNQTKCADPWNTGENSSNTETENAVTQYLDIENVIVISLSFDNNSPLSTDCEACNCGTGQRIIVEVNNNDISEMENLGFYR